MTSVQRSDGPPDAIELLAVSDAGAWLVATPLLPLSVNGAGDTTAALFLAHYLSSRSPAGAVAKTASSVFAVMEATHSAGAREIQLVAAQAAIADPSQRFAPQRIR